MKFFKILLPSFESKLWLPTHFCEEATAHYSPDAMLTTQLGTWEVQLGKSGGKFYFHGDSWDSFVRDHVLSVGDLIQFKHLGRMVFKATVFDSSACEKDFSAKLCPNPALTFHKAITKTSKKNRLYFPMSIWKDRDWILNKRWAIVKMGERGEEHELKLHLYSDGPGASCNDRLYMAKGWPEFCASNGIKLGDSCVFEVMDRDSDHVVIRVTIAR